MAPKNSIYFTPLTGVRAIAAYMVFIHHFNPFKKEYFGNSIHSFTDELHIGVTMFFVLSGFLITYRYIDFDKISFKTYMVNRIARIYPVYFILTSLTFLSFAIIPSPHHPQSTFIYFSNISLIKSFFNDIKFTGISQGWSLTVEETFYLLAPFFFLLIKKSKANLVIIPVLFFLLGLSLVSFFSQTNFYGFLSTRDQMFNYTFFGRAFEFFVGIGVAIIFKQNLFIIKRNLFTYTGLFIIFLCVYGLSVVKGDLDSGLRHPAGMLINSVILPVFGISIFYLGLLREKTYVSKLLGSKVFVLLGKSSYIFYLIHLGIIRDLVYKLTPNYFIDFLLLNIISVLMFKYMEQPLNLFVRKIFINTKATNLSNANTESLILANPA